MAQKNPVPWEEQFSEGSQREIPRVFCWTKMGAEAGQSLEAIVWRKEMERLAGNGTFCWGIGNALGNAPTLARQASLEGDIEVLFTPMKSQAKSIDAAPRGIVIWLTFTSVNGRHDMLPDHMLVTSRSVNPSGELKRYHYGLMCTTQMPIRANGEEVIDAACARNFGSANPVGSSQVTAVVSYDICGRTPPQNPYRVAFRAKLFNDGFVRLGTPVELRGNLLAQFRKLWEAETLVQWRQKILELKTAAWHAAGGWQTEKTDLLGF